MDDRTKTERPEAWPGPITRPGQAPPPPAAPPRRRRGKGWLVFLLGLIAIAGVGWLIYQRTQPTTTTQRPSRFGQTPPVAAAPVQSGDINVTVNALGTVASLATVTVASDDTVPSALTVTLMSPLCTGAAATGGVWPKREGRCVVVVGCVRW